MVADLHTVEGGRRRYLPFSPRAWREANPEFSTATDQVETILESNLDSSEYEEVSEVGEVTITPIDQSTVPTPLPSSSV